MLTPFPFRLVLRKLTYFRMSAASKCIFCNIVSGHAAGEIHYQDNEMVIFNDIKPAATHHFLACPKTHIKDINSLTVEDKELIENLIFRGKQVVEEKGGNVNDCLLGFHCPPFNSIGHLHLHVISPASQMSFLSRMVFRPNSYWFIEVDKLMEKLNTTHKL